MAQLREPIKGTNQIHIIFLNHFPNLNLISDGGTVGMKEAPT